MATTGGRKMRVELVEDEGDLPDEPPQGPSQPSGADAPPPGPQGPGEVPSRRRRRWPWLIAALAALAVLANLVLAGQREAARLEVLRGQRGFTTDVAAELSWRWNVTLRGGEWVTSASGEGLVLLGGEDGHARALDARTGRELWVADGAPGTRRACWPVRGTELVQCEQFADGTPTVEGLAWSGRIELRRAADGELLDARDLPPEGGFAYWGEDLLVLEGAGPQAVLRLESLDGTVRWSRGVGSLDARAVWLDPEEGLAFVGAEDGHLVVDRAGETVLELASVTDPQLGGERLEAVGGELFIRTVWGPQEESYEVLDVHGGSRGSGEGWVWRRPLVDDGTVGGVLAAYRPSGVRLFVPGREEPVLELAGVGLGDLLVVRGAVVLHDGSSIVAYDLRSGGELWRDEAPGQALGTDGSRVLARSYGLAPRLRALDVRTGAVAWEWPLPDGADLLVEEGVVLMLLDSSLVRLGAGAAT